MATLTQQLFHQVQTLPMFQLTDVHASLLGGKFVPIHEPFDSSSLIFHELVKIREEEEEF